MKHIKLFEEIEIKSNQELTIQKLIEILKTFDPNLPVRTGCHGYQNQEVVQIVEKDELDENSDKIYKVLQINGNGSWTDEDSENSKNFYNFDSSSF